MIVLKKVSILVFSFILIIVYAYNAYAQNNNITIEWQKEYQLETDRAVNIAYDAIVLDDGYLITGISGSENGKGNIFLLKVNQTGEKLWSNLYNAKKNQIATSIISNNNQYIVGGFTSDNLLINKESQSYLMMVDDSGNKVSEKTINLKNNNFIVDLKKTEDNNLIIGGYTINDKKFFNPYLIKIDPHKNIIWKKLYNQNKNRILNKIAIDKNNILIGGSLFSINNKNTKAYLIKFDKTGEKIFEKSYGNKGIYATTAILKDIDSYIIGGDIMSKKAGVFISKFSKTGKHIWSRNYYNEELNTINNIYKLNNNYITIGQNKNNNIYIMGINQNGTKLWKEIINNNKVQMPMNVLKTSETSYLIIGYSQNRSDQLNYKINIYLLKIDISL